MATISWTPQLNTKINRIINQAQVIVDSEILYGSAKFIPWDTGTLYRQSVIATQIGTGTIVFSGPQARYLYHGMLMVDPITKKGAYYNPEYGFWSRPGVAKELTNTPLNYQNGRGPRWFETWKANELNNLRARLRSQLGIEMS